MVRLFTNVIILHRVNKIHATLGGPTLAIIPRDKFVKRPKFAMFHAQVECTKVA